MGNEGLYSVGIGMRKSALKKLQVESFAGHSQLGLSCKMTCEIQPSKDYSNFSMCFSCGLLQVGIHELVAR